MDRAAIEQRMQDRFTTLFQAAGVTVGGTLDGDPLFDAVIDDALLDVPLGDDDLVPLEKRRLFLHVLAYYAYDAVLPGLMVRVNRSADSPNMQASLSDMYKAAEKGRAQAMALADGMGWTPEADTVTADSLDLAPADWEYDAAGRQGSSTQAEHVHYPFGAEFSR